VEEKLVPGKGKAYIYTVYTLSAATFMNKRKNIT